MAKAVATKPRKYTRNPGRGSKPGEHRGGRAKGTPNKMTRELKEMILQALDQAGGVKYLVRQAGESPAAFMTLLGKVLPLQVTGKDGGPIETRAVENMTPEQRRDEIKKILASEPQLAAIIATATEGVQRGQD